MTKNLFIKDIISFCIQHLRKKIKSVEDAISKRKCFLQTCPNTAGSHLTSYSGILKQATRKSESRQTGAHDGSPSIKYPWDKNFHSLWLSRTLPSSWLLCRVPWPVSGSLVAAWLAQEFVTEQIALRSQVQCLKEIKLKMDYISFLYFFLLLKMSTLRKCKISFLF